MKNLQIASVIFFEIKGGKYITHNNIELPPTFIIKYKHVIDRDYGYIILSDDIYEKSLQLCNGVIDHLNSLLKQDYITKPNINTIAVYAFDLLKLIKAPSAQLTLDLS